MGEDGMTVVEDSVVAGDSKEKTVIKLYLVQTKSLQECSIIFEDATIASLPPIQTFQVMPPQPQDVPLSNFLPLRAENIEEVSPASNQGTASLEPVNASSPKEKSNTSSDDLAEAASKISLITPSKLKPLISTLPPPDIVNKDGDVSTEADDEPDDEDDDEDGDDEESEYDDASVPKLEKVNCLLEKDFVSGNSSPSREVATILSTEDPRFEDESPNDKTLHDSPSPEFHSIRMPLNSSGSTVFPDPPSLPTSMVAGKLAAQPPLPVDRSPSNFSLETNLKDLQKEIQALKEEVKTSNRREEINAQVEAVISGRVEAALNRTIAISMGKLEQNLKKQEETITNYMTKVINTKCDQILAMELKRNVADTVNRALEPLKSRIDSQIGHKLSNADQVVKDSVYRIVSSPGFQDTIAKNVAQSMQPVISESYREVLQANLPGMDRMLKQILANMNETFVAGTREYETVVRSRLETSENKVREEITPVLREVVRNVANLNAMQNDLNFKVRFSSTIVCTFSASPWID